MVENGVLLEILFSFYLFLCEFLGDASAPHMSNTLADYVFLRREIRAASGSSYDSLTLLPSEIHSARDADSLTQLLTRKAHYSSLLSLARFAQCSHTPSQIQACRIFQILSSYPDLVNVISIFGFFPMVHILGADGEVSLVDCVAIAVLNNLLSVMLN